MYSDSMISKIAEDHSVVGYAVEIIFPAGEPTRAHTGVGNIIINGETYYGVGGLGTVSAIPSQGDTTPQRVSVGLNGLPNGVLPQMLHSALRGNPATLYTLVFNSETGQLQQAEIAVVGTVSDYNVTTGEDNTCNVTISDEYEKFEMPIRKYWTDESYILDHPDDRLCRYAAQMADREIQWGSKNDAPPLRYN